MSRKIIIGVVALVSIFVSLGIAFAYGFNHHKVGGFERFTPNNMTLKYNKFYGHWNIDNITESLGLPKNATREEIKNAMIDKMKTERDQLISKVKDKLGLPQTASDEDVKNALSQWTKENGDLIRHPHITKLLSMENHLTLDMVDDNGIKINHHCRTFEVIKQTQKESCWSRSYKNFMRQAYEISN